MNYLVADLVAGGLTLMLFNAYGLQNIPLVVWIGTGVCFGAIWAFQHGLLEMILKRSRKKK